MSLESGSYISALDSVNPTGSDPKSRGDDHLRLIKSTLKNSFAGITGAVQVGGTNGGLANAYTLTPTPALVSYVTNMTIVFSPVVSNTGASTIDVSGLGPINLRSVSGAALISGELASGQTYKAVFNGTEFRLDSITKNYADQLAFSTALPAQSLGFLASNGTVAAFTKTFTSYAVDESKGANVASAATVDLQNTVVTGNLIHITGTTTITAITLPAGAERTIVFDGILTLTHSASLDLPGAANITTAVGDRAVVRGEGSSVTRVISFIKANGQATVVTPPGMVLLAPPTAITAVANIDFLTIFSSNTNYEDFKIVIDGMTFGSSAALQMRFAVAGVVDSASSYFSVSASPGGTTAVASTSFGITQNAVQSGNAGLSVDIDIFNTQDAVGRIKRFSARFVGQTAASTYLVDTTGGAYSTANAVSGFRVLPSAGVFGATGTIKVYGISKV
jgi:hypothetical protein